MQTLAADFQQRDATTQDLRLAVAAETTPGNNIDLRLQLHRASIHAMEQVKLNADLINNVAKDMILPALAELHGLPPERMTVSDFLKQHEALCKRAQRMTTLLVGLAEDTTDNLGGTIAHDEVVNTILDDQKYKNVTVWAMPNR
jgi:hypothetical protein